MNARAGGITGDGDALRGTVDDDDTPRGTAAGNEADDALPGAQTVRRAMAILRLVACGQERGVRLIDLVLSLIHI